MRVFVAIGIDEQIRKALGDLQSELQSKVDVRRGNVKWVNPQNIHLTLKFLGEIKDQQVVEVCDIVKDAAGRHQSFELEVGPVGHFGGRSARVLWVGTRTKNDELRILQEDIEEHLAGAGWPKEARRFTGHLTLCRIRNSKAGVKLAQLTQAYKETRLGAMAADSVTVYESQLRPAGPIYTALGDYQLK
jgi:2'-5' RNA ligase